MITDFLISLHNTDQWLYLAWKDISNKYRRTVLGPFWLVIISFVSIFCVSMLGALLFKVKIREFAPYVAAGIVAWSYLVALISESCNVFISNSGMIQNLKVNLISTCLRLFVRNTIIFFHNIMVLLLIFLCMGHSINLYILLLLPVLLIYTVASLSFSIICGFICTRYRDFVQIVQTTLNLLMFVTPIWWKPEMLDDNQNIVALNPFYYFIELIRKPLLGQGINVNDFLIALLLTGVLLITAKYFYNNFKKRLPFWL